MSVADVVLSDSLAAARAELRRKDAQIATLLALVPNRDTALLFDRGDVHVDSSVVCRFPATSAPLKREVLSSFDLRRYGAKDVERVVPPVPIPVLEPAPDNDARVDRLEALLAAQTAAFAEFKRNVPKPKEDTRLKDTTAALLEARSKLVEAESRLATATKCFSDHSAKLERGVVELKLKLQAEAVAARQALTVELHAKTARLVAERDAAMLQAGEALQEAKRAKRRESQAKAQCQRKLNKSKADVAAVNKRLALYKHKPDS